MPSIRVTPWASPEALLELGRCFFTGKYGLQEDMKQLERGCELVSRLRNFLASKASSFPNPPASRPKLIPLIGRCILPASSSAARRCRNRRTRARRSRRPGSLAWCILHGATILSGAGISVHQPRILASRLSNRANACRSLCHRLCSVCHGLPRQQADRGLQAHYVRSRCRHQHAC